MGLTIRITVEECQLPKRNFRGIQTLVGLKEYVQKEGTEGRSQALKTVIAILD